MLSSALCCATRDSRQITYSVSNVLRWQRRLDFTIAYLTGKPCTKLEPRVHAILRLAVHEILFQKLPAHAVSEHVNLAKTLVRPAAGSLVNGEPTAVCYCILQERKRRKVAGLRSWAAQWKPLNPDAAQGSLRTA